jgi:hypothetical protein
VLALTFQFNGDCDGCIGGCPDERRSDYVRSLAAYVVSEQLLEYRVDAKVKAAVLECKVRDTGHAVRLQQRRLLLPWSIKHLLEVSYYPHGMQGFLACRCNMPYWRLLLVLIGSL